MEEQKYLLCKWSAVLVSFSIPPQEYSSANNPDDKDGTTDGHEGERDNTVQASADGLRRRKAVGTDAPPDTTAHQTGAHPKRNVPGLGNGLNPGAR